LLLLFLATSVTFVELLNLDPARGKPLMALGFGLAVLVTEGLLLGLGIRLRTLFRGPYYLWLALLYFFPLWVSPEVTGLSAAATSWRLLAFPVSASVLTLALLPAVRRGAEYCQENGTPWSWPLFPWTLFGFMGLATLFRTYALTISFLPSDGMLTAFQPYFLVPFLLAVLVLLLEIGLIERSKVLINIALGATPGLLWLALPGIYTDGPAAEFLTDFTSHLGSPLWLTCLGVVGFHAWAMLRGVKVARWYLLGALLLAVRISPATVDPRHLAPAHSWPLIIAATLEIVRGLNRRHPLMLLAGGFFLSLALSAFLWDSPWFVYRRIIPFHVAMLSILIVGCTFRGFYSRVLRIIGAVLLPASAAAAVFLAQESLWQHWGWSTYLVGLVATTALCWLASRDIAFLCSLMGMLLTVCLGGIYSACVWLARQLGVKVLIPLMVGIGSFVLGTVISISKGILRRQPANVELQPQAPENGNPFGEG
ncbi:MAG: hypothetical protein JWM11_6917, partial [Planctomycetaceae bacterium]|nr:hypothetical protein [Planctomycetaceae bacterium]